MVIPSVVDKEGLINGVHSRRPVLDRTVPSDQRRRGQSRGASLKGVLVAHKHKVRAMLVVGVLVASAAFVFVSALGPSAAESDSLISITCDEEFDADHGVTGGDGSAENPFLISGWIIYGESESYAISISSTTAHFVIRDVTLSSCLCGVYLWSVQNGVVSNSTISGMGVTGISITGGSGIRIENNTISSCAGSGMYIEDSPVVVTYNQLRNNNHGGYSAGGIYVNSVNMVSVYRNGFYGNEVPQALDQYGTGCWSQDPPIGGNYWDDYEAVVGHAGVNEDEYPDFWDDPYPIDSSREDAYPLVDDDVVIPEFSTLVVPVLLVLAVFLISRRRSSAK